MYYLQPNKYSDDFNTNESIELRGLHTVAHIARHATDQDMSMLLIRIWKYEGRGDLGALKIIRAKRFMHEKAPNYFLCIYMHWCCHIDFQT